ncbi:MAG: hypothetical protein K8R74_11475, partial [Bacteroidales bacterium]|nr:hypothetical protein [Bacteroidales bacterium]
LNGKLVKTLLKAKQGIGYYNIEWDGTDNKGKIVTGGTYFSRITYGSESKTIKLMLLK